MHLPALHVIAGKNSCVFPVGGRRRSAHRAVGGAGSGGRARSRPPAAFGLGSGLPMLRRRTFATGIVPVALSLMAALSASCLRLPSRPALGAWAAPNRGVHVLIRANDKEWSGIAPAQSFLKSPTPAFRYPHIEGCMRSRRPPARPHEHRTSGKGDAWIGFERGVPARG